MNILWWDYVCDKCGQVGSVPIIDGTESVTNAAVCVRETHGEFNPECHRKYQGRWVRVLKVGPGDGE